eukprot:603075-Rhodomonas_salina.2
MHWCNMSISTTTDACLRCFTAGERLSARCPFLAGNCNRYPSCTVFRESTEMQSARAKLHEIMIFTDCELGEGFSRRGRALLGPIRTSNEDLHSQCSSILIATSSTARLPDCGYSFLSFQLWLFRLGWLLTVRNSHTRSDGQYTGTPGTRVCLCTNLKPGKFKLGVKVSSSFQVVFSISIGEGSDFERIIEC